MNDSINARSNGRGGWFRRAGTFAGIAALAGGLGWHAFAQGMPGFWGGPYGGHAGGPTTAAPMEEVRRPRGEARCFRRLAVDPAVREACIDGDARAMTSYQFAVLTTLVENAGRVRSREQLMDQVKEVQQEAFGRSIDVHLSRIGQAIEEDPRQPRRITTERGAGYVFAKAQQ